jgi:hypothetical protein
LAFLPVNLGLIPTNFPKRASFLQEAGSTSALLPKVKVAKQKIGKVNRWRQNLFF